MVGVVEERRDASQRESLAEGLNLDTFWKLLSL